MLTGLLLFVAVCLSLACASSIGKAYVAVKPSPQQLSRLLKLHSLVSDVESSLYGQYLSRDELASLVRPSRTTLITLTHDWLYTHMNVTAHLTTAGDWLEMEVDTNSDAFAMLQRHSDEGVSSLPEFVQHLVDAVAVHNPNGPTVSLDQKGRFFSNVMKTGTSASFASAGSPPNQRKAYEIPDSQRGTNKTNLQAVWGPGTYGFLDSDLNSFYQQYSIDQTADIVTREGFPGTAGGDNFGECTLDIQYITGIGVGVPTLEINTNESSTTEEGNGFGDAYLIFMQQLLGKQTVPYVLSFSLGSLSYASCDFLCTSVAQQGSYSYSECNAFLQKQRQVCMYKTADQVSRIDYELMKTGLRGMTLLAAAGDGGSHYSFQPFSPFGIGHELNDISCKHSMTTYPSSSAYVLSVGGTEWRTDGSDPKHWTGGGAGFSWLYPMPEWQKSTVEGWLSSASGLPSPSGFNRTNRAYPDVTALANDVPVIMQGSLQGVGGTSAATPEFAGLVSLLNDIRLNKGLPSLGFVNPRLYKEAAQHQSEMFFDVQSGNTACSSAGFDCCAEGFPATQGWDGATGWGSPRWNGLVKYLTNDQ